MKLKLYRDKVVSIIRGKEMVGLYVKFPHFTEDACGADMGYEVVGEYKREMLLAEMPPKKADAIIKLWNK